MRSWFVVAAAGCVSGNPGTITIDVSGVTGAEGLLLLSEARTEDGRQAGVSCIPIDADPFSVTAELDEITGPTPCEPDPPVMVFDPGTYDVTTVTMQGGSKVPSACAEAQVEVDGDVVVQMPSLVACP